jgi:hypothetical protein
MGLVVLEALQLAGITQGFKRRGVPSTRFGDGGRMDILEKSTRMANLCP